MSLITERRF